MSDEITGLADEDRPCRVHRFEGYGACHEAGGDYVDLILVCRYHWHRLLEDEKNEARKIEG